MICHYEKKVSLYSGLGVLVGSAEGATTAGIAHRRSWVKDGRSLLRVGSDEHVSLHWRRLVWLEVEVGLLIVGVVLVVWLEGVWLVWSREHIQILAEIRLRWWTVFFLSAEGVLMVGVGLKWVCGWICCGFFLHICIIFRRLLVLLWLWSRFRLLRWRRAGDLANE